MNVQVDGEVKKVLQALSDEGFEVAVVGGAVRDIIAGNQVSDWDITTNAKPEEVQKIFPKSFYNNSFGTVTIPLGPTQGIEVTTYRTESSYADKRHPSHVEWGSSLEEDLTRRDFTINAISLPFNKGEFDTKFIDPHKGEEDFKKKIIKAVGNANARFNEDALRMMRAVRFATTLGFEIEPKTIAAIKKNAKSINKISGERIRDELFKIMTCENAASGILLLKEVGLLKDILPELDGCFDVGQISPKRHHIFDVGTHNVMSLANCPSSETIVRFATLLHDVGKAKVANVTKEGVRTFYNHEVVGGRIVLKIAERFHLSREQKKKLFKLVRWHQFTVSENQTDKALRRFIKNIGVENIEDMMDLRVGDRLGGGLQQAESWRLKLFRQRLKEVLKKPFTVRDLVVGGEDVMKVLGIGPGPKVGEILNKLFDEVADEKGKNTREYLLKRIKTF